MEGRGVRGCEDWRDCAYMTAPLCPRTPPEKAAQCSGGICAWVALSVMNTRMPGLPGGALSWPPGRPPLGEAGPRTSGCL